MTNTQRQRGQRIEQPAVDPPPRSGTPSNNRLEDKYSRDKERQEDPLRNSGAGGRGKGWEESHEAGETMLGQKEQESIQQRIQ
ncbi:hypothetical protein M430DRAFT_32325 [Amorphotheca resinae ATCC 22711]|jgi:hypothetical protein|uniref:Uncharacterized protein n=1 Tax=Amorphotheca resinae ATCC 22711 TaxID=857342 RepID=A0A2T3BE69_AMORE|nr:hypothetical protein M430DRAFT_32325 [Amorphotheca resinae ATCC 22711]PSS27685.1 hypothetical protein M430DRAFT_32325 [Amorphotheca resinae ATCC 22711]